MEDSERIDEIADQLFMMNERGQQPQCKRCHEYLLNGECVMCEHENNGDHNEDEDED